MKHQPLWHSPPTDLVLLNKVIHIWRVDLNLPESKIQQLAQTLSSDEQHRAARFYFEKDRKHFIAARGMLRTILSLYIQLEPDQIEFSYSTRGKPAIAKTNTTQTIAFNLSHSKGLALYAIAQTSRLGIDLEYMRSMPDAEQLAKRFFSPGEYDIMSTLLDEQKQEAFFRAWTSKEAYLKAIGEGIPGLDQVEVSLIPGKPAALISIKGDQQAASQWFLHQLTPAPDYIGTLAVEGQGWKMEYLNFE